MSFKDFDLSEYIADTIRNATGNPDMDLEQVAAWYGDAISDIESIFLDLPVRKVMTMIEGFVVAAPHNEEANKFAKEFISYWLQTTKQFISVLEAILDKQFYGDSSNDEELFKAGIRFMVDWHSRDSVELERLSELLNSFVRNYDTDDTDDEEDEGPAISVYSLSDLPEETQAAIIRAAAEMLDNSARFFDSETPDLTSDEAWDYVAEKAQQRREENS